MWKPTGTLFRIAFVPLAAVIAAAGCASTTEPVDAETQAAVEKFVYGTIGEYSKERSDAALARWTYKEDEFYGLQIYEPPLQDRDYVGVERRTAGEVEVYPRVAVSDGAVFLTWTINRKGYGSMFMDEMSVSVEGEIISFPTEPSYDISRDTLAGGKVLETSHAVFSNSQLRDFGKLADASSATLKVSGSGETLVRAFAQIELKLVREARDIYLALSQR